MKRSIDILAGGLRISLAADSNTPGPRAHLLGFCRALGETGWSTRLVLASDFKFLGRFKRVAQTGYATASRTRLLAADIVRLAAMILTGVGVWLRTIGRTPPTVIYERVAVFQSMSSFHAGKGRSTRIVEANGILSRETARDRRGLVLEHVAAVIERRVLRRADLVIAVSEALKVELMRYARVPAGRIHVIPNAADPEFFEEETVASETLKIGFAGSLAKWQRLDDLLLDIAPLVRDFDDACHGQLLFEIIGDGALRPQLEAVLAREPALRDRVRLLGKMPPPEVRRRMGSWAVGYAGHVKTSSDSMYHSPLKLFEYAALGLSIACTRSEVASLLANDGAPVSLIREPGREASAILAALERVPAPAERARIRADLSEKHSWHARVMEFERLLER